MIAKVVHFGTDDCHRLMVLRSAGYVVEDCASLVQLRAVLAGATEIEAVFMSDSQGTSPREPMAVVRAYSSLPAILFQSTNLSYDDSGFDLVVHTLTPPEVWLEDVNGVIERSRAELRSYPRMRA
jgi:hypothetical protein